MVSIIFIICGSSNVVNSLHNTNSQKLYICIGTKCNSSFYSEVVLD